MSRKKWTPLDNETDDSDRKPHLVTYHLKSQNEEKRSEEQQRQRQHNSVSSILSPLVRPNASEVTFKSMRFLIMYRPTDESLKNFIQELQKRKVKDVVRVCEPTYKIDQLANCGITVHDWQFDDGSPPPPQVVENWFNLLRNRFKSEPDCCVAIHCVAGLGRAPVLVALALIELGMKYEDAVELIREKRRGAINAKQLSYLASYRPKSRLKFKSNQNKCFIQ